MYRSMSPSLCNHVLIAWRVQSHVNVIVNKLLLRSRERVKCHTTISVQYEAPSFLDQGQQFFTDSLSSVTHEPGVELGDHQATYVYRVQCRHHGGAIYLKHLHPPY